MGKIALILEGGGMRGAFTAGVLDYFLEEKIPIDVVVGISSGALYGCIYVAGQKDLLKTASIEMAPDKANVGWRAFLSEGQLVAGNRMFDHQLFACGYQPDRLLDSNQELLVGVYDLDNYQTIWKTNQDMAQEKGWLKAACSIPLFAKKVMVEGRPYYDGGLTTMIPIQKALDEGCDRFIVVTTKSPDFVRKPFPKWQIWTLRHLLFPRYKPMIDHFNARTGVYYKERELVDHLVAQGLALNLFPTQETGVGRYRGSRVQYEALFALGKKECQRHRKTIDQLVKEAHHEDHLR